jgi:hypothetical protein
VRSHVFHGFPVSFWSIFTISLEVGLIMMIKVPSMVTNNVWDDFGVGLYSVSIKSFLNWHKLKLTFLLLRLSICTS